MKRAPRRAASLVVCMYERAAAILGGCGWQRPTLAKPRVYADEFINLSVRRRAYAGG